MFADELFMSLLLAGSRKDPRSFPIVRAVRIQNMPLWRDYAHRREELVAKYGDALAHSDANEWLTTRSVCSPELYNVSTSDL